MPAGSRRFRRDDLVAGAWHWLPRILLLLLIVPLPGRVLLHTRSAAYTSRSSAAATAVRFAGDQLGERYQWGGAAPLAYDCSGLTMMAYRSAGVRILRVSRWQYEVGQRVAVRQLVPGDLVFYARNPGDPSTIDHVGTYLAARPGVAAVQTRLRAAGACLAVDGAFGPVTPATVRRFQHAHGLASDGEVSRATWEAPVSNGRQRSRSPSC